MNNFGFARRTLTMILLAFCLAAIGWAQAGPQQFANLGDFKLVSGETIQDLKLGYRTVGQLNADKSNAILFPCWYGGATEQLQGNAVPGGLADSSKYFVILVDPIGNGVSTSPSNSTAQPRMKFPKITMRDMVNAEYALASKTLGLKHLKAVMGISMGGMQSFQWSVSYPDYMDKVIPIVGSPRLAPFDLAHWAAELDLIRLDPAWQGGDYAKNPKLRLRTRIDDLMMTTPADYNAKHKRQEILAGTDNLEESASFDANNYIREGEAMLSTDVSDVFGGDMKKAAAAVKAKMLIIVADQDHMVTPEPAEEFAKYTGAPVYHLEGKCGHLSSSCQSRETLNQVQVFLSLP